MLLRPPFIKQQDVKSQTSNPMDRQPSVKSTSKNKKKENSLGMRKPTNPIGMQYEHAQQLMNANNNTANYDSDTGSVHSVNSRKSKGRAKESTLAIGKKESYQGNNQNSAYSIKNQTDKQEYEIFRLDSEEEDDKRSVGSHASRGSRKNAGKKENSLGGRKYSSNDRSNPIGNSNTSNNTGKVNVQLNYYYNNNDNPTKPSLNPTNNLKNQRSDSPDSYTPPKTYYLQEQSKVQTVKLNENPEPFTQPLKYNQALKAPTLTAKNPQQKARRTENFKPQPQQPLSPFEEITLKRESDSEEEPVYKLKQPEEDRRNYQGTGVVNIFGQRVNNPKTNQNQPSNPSKSSNPFQQPSSANPFTQQKNAFISPNPQPNNPTFTPQQSDTIQPQMISTKSVTKSVRRNKIFDTDGNSIANSSNVMSSRTNMEGSFERSRSKSRSKLGDLLRQSKEKKAQLGNSREQQIVRNEAPNNRNLTKVVSPVHNKPVTSNNNNYTNDNNNFFQNVKQQQQPKQQQRQSIRQSYESTNSNNLLTIQKSNLISVSTLHEQSRIGGQKLGQNPVNLQQIKPKNIQNEVFDLGESRQSQSDLNLSMSNNKNHNLSNIKGDSVHFNFQPEKKKGLSITSKEKPSSNENKSIESKRHLDRLMKKCQENQEFLAKSILSNNSQLRTSQKNIIGNIPSPQITKKEQTLTRPFEKIKERNYEEEVPAWHDMVKDEPAFQIKHVERKEVRRGSEERIVLEQNPRQQQQRKVAKLIQEPVQMAKGPQQLLQNPLYNPKQQQPFGDNFRSQPKDQQNFYKEEVDPNVAQQQKNRILANMEKKSKTQKQRQIVQNPPFKPSVPQPKRQQEVKSQRKEDRQRQQKTTNLPPPPQQYFQQQPQRQNRYEQQVVQSSAISHELSLSENGSERSNSQSTKKNKKKESSLNLMKKHKVQVRDQSPRGEESFYQESNEQKKHDSREKERQREIQRERQIEREKEEEQRRREMKRERQRQEKRTRQNERERQENRQQERILSPNRESSPKMESSGRNNYHNNNNDYKKPNLINFGQSDTEEQKIKSKTDMNFYNYGEMSQKSMRPPSSKPPLSRKSGHSSSKSKSKAKQSTLNINMVKKENKMIKNSNQGNSNNRQQQQPKKKKTLLDIAQDKDYEGSGYGGSDSQCSFNSRESFGSVNSRGSRKSSGSRKESTLPITIKNKATTSNNFRPSLNKIQSTTSQVQIYETDRQSIYNQLPDTLTKRTTSSRERQNYEQQSQYQQPRTIISKDTYFIDERGRLVKQDLVIQGNKVYGRGGDRNAEQMAVERMKRSREHHRSRSKSRDGSRSRLSQKNSGSSVGDSGYDSGSSSNYFNPITSPSNYNNSQYASTQKQNLYIEEFVKPIQQPISQNYKFVKPSSNQRKIEREFYENEERGARRQQQQYGQREEQDEYYDEEEEEPVRNVTLNELFGRNQKQSNQPKPTPYQNTNNPYTNSNNYNTNQRSRYGNNEKFNGQESRQSAKKKSISRTEKTFYNR